MTASTRGSWRRRIALLIACTSLILTLGAFTAAPVAAAEPNGTCSNVTQQNIFNGVKMSPINYSYTRGVRAVIRDEDKIWRCTGADVNNGAMYWIALTPTDGNGNSSTILQIGVIKCYDTLYPGAICDDGGEGVQHIFWAFGGCNGYNPTALRIADAPDGPIEFQIRRADDGSGYYELGAWDYDTGTYLGGVIIHHNHSGITCWINDVGDVEPDWFCERWDGNDGCGDDGAKISFHGMKFQNSTGGPWIVPGDGGQGETLTDIDCYEQTSEDFCDMADADSMYLWTQQGS
jgi:hypothetical protein